MVKALLTVQCGASLTGECHLELGSLGSGPGSAIYPAGGLTSPSKSTIWRAELYTALGASGDNSAWTLLSKLHPIPTSPLAQGSRPTAVFS